MLWISSWGENAMVQYLDSPVGILKLIADQRKLRSVELVERAGENRPNAPTEEAARQLREYFRGERKEFDLFLIYSGTNFERLVWSAMSEIPYGKMVTYGQLAAKIGQPTACRAVANAVGKNPFLILLPCHRVVASHGLGGFSAGLEAKRKLLTLEGIEISESSVFSGKYLFTFS
ncbi:MAG: methylated-DNA--[Oscillospiraceae bacterium]|nr:methylated-DNA--[protein]-cysteine S-methyltransferase [Oscillospiraceae bacterium]